MKKQFNECFESDKEDDISWKEIYDKIPKVLEIIQQILVKKSEDKENNINIQEFLKELKFEVKADEPYIMNESDFDDTNFYKYILKVSLYYLNQENINVIINKLNPPILKHLIDLCAIIKIILNEKTNYEKSDVKYYIYHIINAFSDNDEKLENDFKFLKYGIELLLKNYNINDYTEYFSEKDKKEIRNKFNLTIKKLLLNIQQYMLNNKHTNDETKYVLLEKIGKLSGKARYLSGTETKYLENVKSFFDEFSNALKDEKIFESIHRFFFIFKTEIPEKINKFYYSIFSFIDKIKLEKKYKKLERYTYFNGFKNDYICDLETKNSFLIYYIQFIKSKTMFNELISGTNSNKKYFEELLDNKQFRDKIINFYSSQKIKDFIKEKCDDNEKDKLIEKLPYLLDLMKKDDFWKKIMLFPIAKNKMASVENYLRIVVNTEYVKYHNTPDSKKMPILNLLLFELLIHEIFHYLRRLIFLGRKAKDAITPPSSYNKDSKDNEEDSSSFEKENEEEEKKESLKEHGEIGQRLINYIFHVEKIVNISYSAGKAFENYTLNNEKEIKLLKKILLKEDSSYATFTFTEINGIVHKIYDCCCKSDY